MAGQAWYGVGMTDETVQFSERLRDAMERANMTPRTLQEAIIRAGGSASYATVANWLDGRTDGPQPRMLRILCSVLGCDYTDLLGSIFEAKCNA